MVYTRILPPEEYGLYSLVYTTVLFVETLAFSWLNQSALRYLEKFKKGHEQAFFSTTLLGFVFLASLVIVIWVVGVWVFSEKFAYRLRYMLFLGPLVVFFDSGTNLMLTLLRAMRESLRYSLQRCISAFIKLAASLALIFLFSMGGEAVLYGIAFAGAAIFSVEFLRLGVMWRVQLKNVSLEIVKQFSKYGLPLVGLSFANLVLSASDRYFIEMFRGTGDVGIYAAGYKITETGVFLFVTFIMLSFFPVLIETFEREGELEARKLMQDIMSLFLVLLLPVVTGMGVLSRDIIMALLGEGYLQAYSLLPWISAGIFFMGFSSFFNKSFELKERTLLMLLMLIGAALLNIFLNLILIPPLGNLGAAVSTCLAYLSYLVVSVVLSSRILSWGFPWGICLKALLASLIMGLIIGCLPMLQCCWISLLYKIAVGFIIYVAIIILLEKRVIGLAYRFLTGKSAMPGSL